MRTALAGRFGAARLALDYGADSDVTSPMIAKYLYAPGARRDVSGLVGVLRDSGNQVLMGHFNYARYGDFFEPYEIMAFVREPLVRLCSEYLHRVRRKTFIGTFDDFMETPSFQNMQAKFLQGCPDGVFIGITECYRESLHAINGRFGLHLAHKKRNRGARGGGQRMADELPSELVERFRSLNGLDIELYGRSRMRFEEMLQGREPAVDRKPSQAPQLRGGNG